MRIAKDQTVSARCRVMRVDLMVAFLVIALAPLHAASAYVDPNSAGALYQILFPILVAIASMFSVLRRAVLRLWTRVVSCFKRTTERESTRETQGLP